MIYLPHQSMADQRRASESSMHRISARVHQMVSEPLRSSAVMSSSGLSNHQWQHNHHLQWDIHHQVPSFQPTSSPHLRILSANSQIRSEFRNNSYGVDHPQYFNQDSRSEKHFRTQDPYQFHHFQRQDFYQGFRSEDLVERPCTKQKEALKLQGIEKTMDTIIEIIRSVKLDIVLLKEEMMEEMTSSPQSSPQDPNEIKTRGCDESIRDNLIRINEELEEYSQESHTDFRSEVSVEKEQEASLWSMLKDYIGSEPLSSLQKCSEDLGYSYLIDQAYGWGKKNNDLLRMLKVGAFATSGSASTEEKVSHQPMDLLPRPRPPPQPPPQPHKPPPKLQETPHWKFIKQVESVANQGTESFPLPRQQFPAHNLESLRMTKKSHFQLQEPNKFSTARNFRPSLTLRRKATFVKRPSLILEENRESRHLWRVRFKRRPRWMRKEMVMPIEGCDAVELPRLEEAWNRSPSPIHGFDRETQSIFGRDGLMETNLASSLFSPTVA